MRASRTVLALIIAVLSLAVLQPARAETTLRLLSGWTPNNPNVPLIEAVFIKNVEAASNGRTEDPAQRAGGRSGVRAAAAGVGRCL